MADVKWIKMSTSIFDNRKIRQIESLPDGDAIIVIWMKLLCLAGNINDSGMIYFTKEIPYTEQMMATQFNRPLATVQMAMRTFEQFGMVEIINDMLHISNWEKYQNVEGMDKIREQNRLRQKKWYEKHKALPEPNVRNNVTITQPNATDKNRIDKDIEEDKDNIVESDKPIPKQTSKPAKHKYGEYQHVLLTDTEFNNLARDFSNDLREKAIKFLDEYIEETGYKKKSHYLTIRRWVIDAVKEQEQKQTKQTKTSKPNQFNNFQQRSYSTAEMDALERKLLGLDKPKPLTDEELKEAEELKQELKEKYGKG